MTLTDDADFGDEQRRVQAIRSRVMVLSPSFHARYLDWFMRLGAQDLRDEDVPEFLSASAAELSRLDTEHRGGRVSAPSLAVARQAVRSLAEVMVRQEVMSPESKRQLHRYIGESLALRLLDGGGRYSHDWFYYHEPMWRKHFGHLAGVAGLRALEIGCFEGRSTCWLLRELLTGEGSSIVCVDPFIAYDGQERNFNHNIHATGQAHRVIKLRGPSQQILHFLEPLIFDFIYVDGSHSALDVVQDAALAWQLLKPNGVMVFDDYEEALLPAPYGFPVKPAVDAFLAMISGRHDVLFRDWQLAVRKRGKAPG
jgi:SAM-dependent methyltransferase